MVLQLDAALDKKYVHKSLQDNVFVKNLRRAIPAYFEKETVENIIIPSLPKAQQDMFLEYYRLQNIDDKSIIGGNISLPEHKNEKYYVLFNIPHFLSTEVLDILDHSNQLDQKEIRLLHNYYRKNNKNENYILKNHLSDEEVKDIYSILYKKNIHISNIERLKLAEIIENIPGLTLEKIFYADLVIDSGHSFFFEHPNDHVPGVMLIEAARQFTTACSHIYGKVPLHGVQFVLSQYNSKFYDYVDLHYPAGMKAEFISPENNKDGEWLFLNFHVTLYQKGTIRAYFEMEGRLINRKLFKRLRDGRNSTDPAHRFYPIKSEDCTVSLWDSNKNNYIKAKLVDISFDGFRLEMEEMPENCSTKNEYEFIMCFPQIGFIRGCSLIKWQSLDMEIILCGFHISRISKPDKENIREIIKQYCYLRTDRE